MTPHEYRCLPSETATVDRVARAMLVPLGYSPDVDWERTWVGNQMDGIEAGSLAHLCRELAIVAIAALDTGDPA